MKKIIIFLILLLTISELAYAKTSSFTRSSGGSKPFSRNSFSSGGVSITTKNYTTEKTKTGGSATRGSSFFGGKQTVSGFSKDSTIGGMNYSINDKKRPSPTASGRQSDRFQFPASGAHYRYYKDTPKLFPKQWRGVPPTNHDNGFWSGLFLYSLLDNVVDAALFAHNHSNDEDYRAWRLEADKQAENDPELKAKLAEIDEKTKSQSNDVVDKNWLPSGVKKSSALSDKAYFASLPELSICTGPANGAYYRTAKQILEPNLNDIARIKLITTNGTPEILANLASKKCDAGFIQNDHMNQSLKPLFTPFLEAAHFICNSEIAVPGNDHGHNLVDKTASVHVPKNSGSLVTWQKLTNIEPGLSSHPLILDETYGESVNAVKTEKTCAFIMEVPHADGFFNAINDPKVRLIDLSLVAADADLEAAGYSRRTLSSTDYNQVVPIGFFESSAYIKTLVTAANFVINDEWKAANRDSFDDVIGRASEIYVLSHQFARQN